MTHRDSPPAPTKTSFPFLGILGIVFITLKLCGVVGWPWVWVLTPLWAPFALVLLIAALAAACGFVAGLLE